MSMFRSLRLRMAISHGLVLAVLLLVLGAAGYLLLARSLDHTATAAVSAAVAQQADLVRESGAGAAAVPPDNDVPSSLAVRTAVFLPDGSPLGEPGELPTWLRPQPTAIATVASHGERVRVATQAVRVDGRLVATVVSGRSLAPEEETLHHLRLLVVVGGAAAVALGMLAGWLLAGRAVKPVRRAYEAQAAFAADASHEFRTPLAFIRSGVEVLRVADPHLGDEVLGEVEHMTGLTERLLLLARAERGGLKLRLAPLEVASLAREAVDRAHAALGLDATVVSPAIAVVSADADALRAAFDGVLENVVRHGGGRAEVDVCALAGGWVRIAIIDHGPGLPDELRSRAFDRFVRADAARSGGGAGLGLSLARAMVEAQGGTMHLEETEGGGLTTVLRLRVALQPTPMPAEAGAVGRAIARSAEPSEGPEGPRAGHEGVSRRSSPPDAVGSSWRATDPGSGSYQAGSDGTPAEPPQGAVSA